MNITFLYHSGFLVETQRHILLFDYYLDTPKGGGLSEGVFTARQWRDKDVLVFVSHAHSDHYNPVIWEFSDAIPHLRYILSRDVPVPEPQRGIYRMAGEEDLALEDLTVHTLTSTDEGVAFVVTVDGQTIYHAGDLNWWHWDGEPEEENREMGRRYRRQIQALAAFGPLDAAFIPVDPRLESTALWGLDALMRQIPVRLAIPMHFTEDPTVFLRIQSDTVTQPYRRRICGPLERGMTVSIPDSPR